MVQASSLTCGYVSVQRGLFAQEAVTPIAELWINTSLSLRSLCFRLQAIAHEAMDVTCAVLLETLVERWIKSPD